MSKQKTNITKFDFITLIITFIFIIINAFLGIYYSSIWHGTISVYYMFLILIRLLIIINENKIKNKTDNEKEQKRLKCFYITFIILLFLDISLLVPITLMAFNERSYNFGLIIAIAFASYTTYKIIMTIIIYKRNRSNDNITFRELKTIDLIDAIISILTLQNTLIIANDGFDNAMFILTYVTSFIALVFIIFISILLFVKVKKYNKGKKAI